MTLDDCDHIFDKALGSAVEAEFCHVVAPLFDHYKILSVDWGRGSIFWRARIVHDTMFENLAEMNYPPSHVARVGRLNDAGSPCFYVSARKETAITEIDAEAGHFIQLAGFRVLDANPVRLALIGEYSNVQKVGYMHFAGRDPDMALSKLINSMPRHDALRMVYIDKFFAHVLADIEASKKNYMMSRALTQVIYSKCKADGIVFPSVKDRGGFNLGVKPAASDKSFHNVCCIVVRLRARRRFGLLEFDIIKSAKSLDSESNFVWDDSLAGERIGFYGLSKEEFELAARAPGDPNTLLDVLHQGRL
ncbi:RES family NAD+ phosphorylase [Burkholderia cepacia]|uniref:RES family NAD+ phosphorylase n=1 Tax=Burkholderia cepacia TaxID=292 RepID=UPI00234BE14D|nr:RES family NAD+ phosphorylase [Burkholderia cepacia]MDC6098591.1 RES family NAD+ phosphorylase [Burkholderia cepacia]